jgi:hypothetical protein
VAYRLEAINELIFHLLFRELGRRSRSVALLLTRHLLIAEQLLDGCSLLRVRRIRLAVALALVLPRYISSHLLGQPSRNLVNNMTRLLAERSPLPNGIVESAADEEDGVGEESTKFRRTDEDDENIEEGLGCLLAELGRGIDLGRW